MTSDDTSTPTHDDLPWPERARVMVCVGYNPLSQRLIRRASQLARALAGDLVAVHVQADDSDAPGYRAVLDQNMALAQDLGAEVVVAHGAPLAEVLARVAQQQQVTHMVMGESARSRWVEIQHGSLVRQLLRASRGIDVYIVADPA